ncbi:hypothetical protein QVD17_16710 [Tagetes erecta]|uniref:Uncharacterized protein n=1 Tax=Tagetes erecta TaxID=13708 RepID=A0AAD8KX62_TARER|nr:hypothetical protein QVD17_16710 [Tagetes erecta]
MTMRKTDSDDSNDGNDSIENVEEEDVIENVEEDVENNSVMEPFVEETISQSEPVMDEMVPESNEPIDVVQTAQEVIAEVESVAQVDDEIEVILKEKETESSESDKDFAVDEDVGVSDTPREITDYYTRSRRSKTVTEPIVESVPIPDDTADMVPYDKAEGKT